MRSRSWRSWRRSCRCPSARAAQFVYVSNFSSVNVSQYEVGVGGLLAPLVPPATATASSPLGVTVSPDGRSVYVVNRDLDRVSQYDVSGAAL